MSADGDSASLMQSGVVYSYASVADTFFWGEKRQYLPHFQSRAWKREEPDGRSWPRPRLVPTLRNGIEDK